MVGRLTASAGIERRAVKHDTVALGVDGNNPRVEDAQVAVGLEELVGGHGLGH